MSERNTAFGLFVLGALLFAAALVLSHDFDFPLKLEAFTILFGLPYLLREMRRETNWLLVLYLVILVPAFHYLAVQAAINVRGPASEPNPMLAAGLAGGFVGAGLSFLALSLPGLRAEGTKPLPVAAALIVLTGLGGLGLSMADLDSRYDLVFRLYLPWQTAFGFFLSRLLRPSPRRQAAA